MKTEGGERNNNTDPKKWFRAQYWQYKLFLDDTRQISDVYKSDNGLPDGKWVTVRSYHQFVNEIYKRGLPVFISFDHDLDSSAVQEFFEADRWDRPINYNWIKEKTGKDCAEFLVDWCNKNKLTLPAFNIHSANHIGAENIRKILNGQKI
jgi:hypothetical protein